MASYEILRQDGEPRSFKTDHGEFISYRVIAKGPNGQATYEIVRKPTSPPPSPGAVIEAEEQPPKNPNFPAKLKLVTGGARNGGGYRSTDPQDAARMSRASALQSACSLAEKRELSSDQLVALAAKFEDFIFNGRRA